MDSISRTEHRPAACAPSGHFVRFRLAWKRSATPLGAQTWRSVFRTCRMRQTSSAFDYAQGRLRAPQSLQSQIEKSKVENTIARVAELADAPDLGLRNHRFQSVVSRFKTKPLHDRKTADFGEILQSTNTEQKTQHSSTNSSTPDAPESRTCASNNRRANYVRFRRTR